MVRKWKTYSVLKKIALYYLATQLTESDYIDIKYAFLVVNSS